MSREAVTSAGGVSVPRMGLGSHSALRAPHTRSAVRTYGEVAQRLPVLLGQRDTGRGARGGHWRDCVLRITVAGPSAVRPRARDVPRHAVWAHLLGDVHVAQVK